MRKLFNWLARRGWCVAALVLIAVAMLYVFAISGKPGGPSRQEIVTKGGTRYPGWSWILLVGGIIAAVLAVGVGVEWWEGRQFRSATRRKVRVDRLTASLNQALRDIERIRTEVDEGSSVLARLEEDAAAKAQLARLSSEDAKAVLTELRYTVRGETSRGTRWGFVMNMVFFAAGVGVSILLQHH